MAGLSISRAWDEARAIMGRDSGLFVSVALALFVLPQIVAGVISTPTTDGGAAGVVVMILAALLGLVGQLAIVRLSIGQSVSVGEAIAHGFRRFPMLFLAMLLLILLYALLLVPIVIVATALGVPPPQPGAEPTPGMSLLILIVVALLIALWPKFSLSPPVASEEGSGPVRILRRSWDLTKGNYGRLLGLMLLIVLFAVIVLFPAGIIGGILGRLISPNLEAFSLGAFVAALIAGLAQAFFSVVIAVLLARVYVQLASGSAERLDRTEPSRPSGEGR